MVSVSTGESLLSKYLSFFTYRGESLIRRSGSSWREVSRFHSLSDQEIADSLQISSKLYRAFCLDSKSRYLIIHIPASGNSRSPEFIKQVLEALQKIGISAGTYQFEEDWYLYIYFSQQVKLNKYTELLSQFLQSAGVALEKDSISVLRQGQHAPLPLQPGFAWIDDAGQPVQFRSTLTTQDALQRWLFESEALSIDPDAFEQLCLDAKTRLVQSVEDMSGQLAPPVQVEIDSSEPVPALFHEPLSDSGSELDLSIQESDCPDSSGPIDFSPYEQSGETKYSQDLQVTELVLEPVQSDHIDMVIPDSEQEFEDLPEQLPLFPDFPVPKLPESSHELAEPQLDLEIANKRKTADAFPQLSLFPDLVPGAQVIEQSLELPKNIPKRMNRARRAPPDTG